MVSVHGFLLDHTTQLEGILGGFGVRQIHTLNPNMDVVLRLLSLPCIFVGFGEGVYERNMSAKFRPSCGVEHI
jgi:hypothetical protein